MTDPAAGVLPRARLDLTCRALGHVLGVSPTQLREDSPLSDVGADSVALLAFADVVEAFAADAGLSEFVVDSEQLRLSRSVGELSESMSWRS